MKKKPNIDDFLESGVADLANKKPQSINDSVTSAKVQREQKIFRLPIDLINELKREAYEQSVKAGTRVTETELVEQALRAFLKIDI